MERINRNITTVLKVFAAGIAFVLVYLILRGDAWSAEFELNKPQVEEGIYCFSRQAALDVANEPSDSTVVLVSHMASGRCIIAQAVVVYSRKVYQSGKVNVYEGKIGTTTIFNPSTFTAKGERDI